MSAELEQRVKELEEEVRYLKKLLGFDLRKDCARVLSSILKTTAQEARLLMALYDSQAKYVSRWDLLDRISRSGKAENSQGIWVLVHRLRKNLGEDIVVTLWGEGLTLSERGRNMIRDILEANNLE